MDFGGSTFESSTRFPSIDKTQYEPVKYATGQEVIETSRRFIVFLIATNILHMVTLLTFFPIAYIVRRSFKFVKRRLGLTRLTKSKRTAR